MKFAMLPGKRLQNYLWFQRDPLDFLVSSRSVGDVVSIYDNDRRPTFIVHHPEAVQQILVTKEKSFVKGRASGILKRTVGEGVLTSEGQAHERQKRAMMPAFAKQNLEDYADTVSALTREMVKGWKPGETRSISRDMMLLTLRIICQTMLGLNLQREADKIGESVEACIRYSAARIYSPLPIPLALPIRSNREYKAARRILYKFANEHQRGQAPLLHQLLQGAFPQENIRDQIITILIAGHETTANLLGWVFDLIARHPQVGESLHQELRGLGDEPLSYEHLPQLPYAQAVILETLRMYPPAWAILRENVEPVELSGHRIDGHGSYIISPYAMHRDPQVFPEPDKFNPLRFYEREGEWPRFAYLPFGAGPRACIGSQYAMMEATLILAGVWQRGRLTLPDPAVRAVPEPSVSLRIKGGLNMNWNTSCP